MGGNRISASILGAGLVFVGLGIAQPARAQQTAAPQFTSTYFDNAYLDADFVPAGADPNDLLGVHPAPQTLPPGYGPGGASGGGMMGMPGPGYPGGGGAGNYLSDGSGASGMGQPGAGGTAPSSAATAAGEGMAPALAAGLGGGLAAAQGGLNMIGDQGPFAMRQAVSLPQPPTVPPPFPPKQPPKLPNPKTRSLLVPSVRGFKIADNQSPYPQDRVFFSFNYFDNVNARLNRDFQSPITNVSVFRYVYGMEKTYHDGMGSVGFLLPLNSVHAATRPGQINQGGTSTSLGDMTVYTKYVLAYNAKTGDLVSTGFAVTPPTGPPSFANASFLKLSPSLHTTALQPFLGYYFARGDFFFHGFSAIDVPVNFLNPLMMYNDVGVGYYLRRDPDARRFLTAIVPTFETHVNTPLNHRDPYNVFDKAGTPDVVNLTAGINFEFHRRSVLTFGLVEAVTGPRPFDLEAVVLLNFRFGTRALGAQRSLVPMIGG